MSDVLLVECPIHLDAVPIADILVFKCGHGFCEPCLEEHFSHAQSSHVSCPTCRKTVRRKEAFPLFLTPAQPPTGTMPSGQSTPDHSRMRMMRELREAKAAHANCPKRFAGLQHEIDTLGQEGVRHNQRIQHLCDRYELLEGRLAKEADNSARAKEESNRMKEEVTKLQVENHKLSKAHDEAVKEIQVQLERVKMFQGCIERHKHKYNLEKKKRKAIGDANHHLLPRKEDDSLMVVDANAPDVLRQDGHDFGWLDEACKVKGDHLAIPGDEDLELGNGSEDEVQLSDPDTKGKQRYSPPLQEDQIPGPPFQFRSDWNIGLEASAGPSSGITRRQRHDSKQVGGSRIVKVKMPVRPGVGTHKPTGGPLVIDRRGRVKGTVALGPRQKLNSKN